MFLGRSVVVFRCRLAKLRRVPLAASQWLPWNYAIPFATFLFSFLVDNSWPWKTSAKALAVNVPFFNKFFTKLGEPHLLVERSINRSNSWIEEEVSLSSCPVNIVKKPKFNKCFYFWHISSLPKWRCLMLTTLETNKGFNFLLIL